MVTPTVVDLVLLGVLALSVIVGLWRGLVFEVLSLLGWVAAYVVAQWFAPDLAPLLPIAGEGSPLRMGAAFALVFIAAIIVWGIAARLLRMVIHATPLSIVDRLLGALFGVLRGLVLLLALVTVVAMTPARTGQEWRRSQGVALLEALLQEIKPMLPDAVARHLPA